MNQSPTSAPTCVSCRCFRDDNHECVHPLSFEWDYVHGVGKPRYAAVMRLESQPCGTAGKLWEPRPPSRLSAWWRYVREQIRENLKP